MGFILPRSDNDFVDNKKAKPITFTKSKGRISLKMGNKDIGGERLLFQRMTEMKEEVKNAEKGHTVTTMKDFGGASGTEFERHGIKSTFPKWFGEVGFKSKQDFLKVLNSKKGVRFDRLVGRAITDLSEGYDTSFGPVPESRDFLVKSRQKFDNRGITFRMIKGKVRPMRGGNSFNDRIPF